MLKSLFPAEGRLSDTDYKGDAKGSVQCMFAEWTIQWALYAGAGHRGGSEKWC